MTPHFAAFVLLACALCAAVAHADVSHLGYNRFGRLTTRLQRQQARPTAYPAAGFRPQQPFDIPPRGKQQFFQNDLDEANAAPSLGANGDNVPTGPSGDSIARPNVLYGAPARFRSFDPAPQRQRQRLLPQQTYAAPERSYGAPEAPQEEPQAERITAAAVSAQKSERLTDNREDREDDDEDATDIEVDERASDKKPASAQPTTNVVYYPAGAVGFVHPLAAYVQPTAAYYAQPATLLAAAPAAPAAAPKSDASARATAASAASAAPARITAAAPAPAVAPALAVAQPQYFASPFLQKLTYAVPAQLQAW